MNDFNQSLGILRSNDDPVSLAIAHNNKAVVEIKNANFKEAFKSAKTAIKLVEPLIFESLNHNSESSLKQDQKYQEILQVLLIAYRNFCIVQKKLNNIKYAKTVYNHLLRMANKLLSPKTKSFDFWAKPTPNTSRYSMSGGVYAAFAFKIT